MRNLILSIFLFSTVQLLYAQNQKPGNITFPYSFRENKGQITDQQGQPRTDIDFSLQTPDMALTVGNAQLHYQFVKTESSNPNDTIRKKGLTIVSRDRQLGNNNIKHFHTPALHVYRMDVLLLNANKQATIIKENGHEEQYRYYNPKNREQGVTTVNAYEKIVYKNIYPHIDWVLYIKGQDFKYDFIVHPGGRVTDIKLQYQGADSIALSPDGSLRINTPLSKMTESAPYVYELESRKAIPTKYVLKESTVSFSAAPHRGTLVIDPGVDWATYFGGSLDEYATDVTSDGKGNVFIVGYTSSMNNIATTGAHQSTFGGGSSFYEPDWGYSGLGTDGFLAKFNSSGQLLWATYYGGENTILSMTALGEFTASVACDQFGHIYIAGGTNSENGIATPGSFQDTFSTNFIPDPSGFPTLNTCNAYLAQFNTNGVLQWGTYYGASTTMNWFSSIACDKYGNVYATGTTDSAATSSNIATSGAFQPGYAGGDIFLGDGEIVKFDSNGNRLWGTYYGGSSEDGILAITCDTNANFYITGILSAGLGTPGTHIPISTSGGGFLAKFDSSGARQWCSYIPGQTQSVAINAYNQLYVGGNALGYNFYDSLITTPGAFMEQNTGGWCDFLMQMNPVNGQRNWGTYYGGAFGGYTIFSNALACDPYGNVFLTGASNSMVLGPGSNTNLATPGSHQDTLNAPQTPPESTNTSTAPADMFLVKFDSTGVRKWATYYGGENTEGQTGGFIFNTVGLDIDNSGSIFLYSATQSTTAIATPGAYQSSLGGGWDAFLVKFLPLDIAISKLLSPENDTLCAFSYPLSLRVKNRGQMDKMDPLVIHYSYTGPSNGSDSLVFPGVLSADDSAVYTIGNLPLTLPGSYSFTVYLNYTKDDDERNNDTLHFNVFVIAPPVADINMYNIGDVYHFSNNNPQASDDTYLWSFGDGQTSTLPEPSHTYAEGAVYTMVVTISNPCGSTSDTITINNGATGIDNIALADQLNVYPNPANKELFIKTAAGLRLQSYTFINSLGSVMQQGDISRSNIIRLGAIASGVYILRINTNKGVVNKQVVIQNE